MAGTVVDGTIWVVGGLGAGSKGSRKRRGLRPRDQRLEVRSRPAGRAPPRDGRDLQGRGRRDRRLDPQGIWTRAPASRTACSRCATASGSSCPPCSARARRARPPWSATGSWSPAARPTTAWSRPRRCSTASSGERCRHPDAARAPRGGLGRRSTSTRSAGATWAPTRTPRRSSATTPPPTAGRRSPTCRLPAAASGPRSWPAICSRSAARPRRAPWARSSPTTSRARTGRARPRCAPPGTGSRWTRSAARSTRSAAPRSPGTRARWGRRR